jgi:hypothetical protein
MAKVEVQRIDVDKDIIVFGLIAWLLLELGDKGNIMCALDEVNHAKSWEDHDTRSLAVVFGPRAIRRSWAVPWIPLSLPRKDRLSAHRGNPILQVGVWESYHTPFSFCFSKQEIWV